MLNAHRPFGIRSSTVSRCPGDPTFMQGLCGRSLALDTLIFIRSYISESRWIYVAKGGNDTANKGTIIGLCVVVVIVVAAIIIACTTTSNNDDSKEQGVTMGTVVGDGVMELPVIEDIDFDSALEYFEELYGHYGAKFGCTVVGKHLDEEDGGDMIIGRSYDITYSHAPGYIVRTAIPDHYRTIGIAHNAFGGMAFDEVVKNGLTEMDLWAVYCMTGDVLNEKGFYIEANMRPEQPEGSGFKESSGTNPGADVRLCFATLVRYLGERAATVDEAVEIAYTLDVYGLKDENHDWGGGLFMADATGHYGVLELVDNKLVWNDMQQAQANFYISPEYKDKSLVGNGLGRYDTLMAGVEDVHDEADMLDLIRQVRFQYVTDPDTSPFDTLSEYVGEDYNGKIITLQDLDDPEIREVIYQTQIEYGKNSKMASFDDQMANDTWRSAYQTVINCNERTIIVQFFEDTRLIYHVSFEGDW